MISYREKELLMVMKMLQEETEHTTSHMQSVLRSMNTKEKQISIINTDNSVKYSSGVIFINSRTK